MKFSDTIMNKNWKLKEMLFITTEAIHFSHSNVQMKISLFCIDAILKITFNQITSVL